MRTSRRLSLLGGLFSGLLVVCGSPSLKAIALSENNFGNPAAWTPAIKGTGPSLTVQPHGFTATMPGNSSGNPIGAQFDSTFTMEGDFNVEVDYLLSNWPSGNGTRVGIGIAPWYGSQRVSEVFSSAAPDDDAYVFVAGGVAAVQPTTDMEGRLRLSRTGSVLSGFYWNAAEGWILFGSGAVSIEGFHASIGVFSDNSFFNDQTVVVDFRNVNMSADAFIGGPPESVPPQSVPEASSSLLLFAIGLVGIALIRR